MEWDMCWVFFPLWWARLSEVIILSDDDWVCIFICLLFGWCVLLRVLLVVWWYQVLYSSGFLCGSSHYLILPRVSSLVVYAIGVSAPTPKSQGFISGQEWRSHRWFLTALNEIRTNTQSWETEDEPQTNGSYKIRQTIIKIMAYTPISKIEQSNKNKVK